MFILTFNITMLYTITLIWEKATVKNQPIACYVFWKTCGDDKTQILGDTVNMLRPEQHGHHLAEDIFKWIFELKIFLLTHDHKFLL